jgi:hypothetical protein
MVLDISDQVESVEESDSLAQGCADPTEVLGHVAELESRPTYSMLRAVIAPNGR